MSSLQLQLDSGLRIAAGAQALQQGLGYAADQPPPPTLLAMVPRHDQAALRRLLESSEAARGPLRGDTRFWHADGRALPFALSIQPGPQEGWQLQFNDISQRRMEETLAAERGYWQRLGRSLAGWTHELATPLGVANMSLSLLPDALAALQQAVEQNEALAEPVERLQRAHRLAADNVEQAVRRLSAYQTLAADLPRAEVGLIDLAGFLQQLLIFEHPNVKHSPLNVGIDCPASTAVRCNPAALFQILHEAISNSLRHACCGGDPVRAHIQVSADQENTVLQYRDEGPGLSADALARLPLPFYSTAADEGLLGLGLFRAAQLAQQMGAGFELFGATAGGLGLSLRFPALSA